jgi:hypothetical protein
MLFVQLRIAPASKRRCLPCPPGARRPEAGGGRKACGVGDEGRRGGGWVDAAPGTRARGAGASVEVTQSSPYAGLSGAQGRGGGRRRRR